MQKKTEVVKSKVTAQKWLWWSDNITAIQVNFGTDSQLDEATQIHPNCCYAIIRPPHGSPPLTSKLLSCCLF